MIKYWCIVLINSILFSNSCFRDNIISEQYYTKENYIFKGYQLGNRQLYIDFYDHLESQKIVLKVYEIDSHNDTLPLSGVNCCMLKYKNQLTFKRKKRIANSDNNGIISIDKKINVDFLSIDYPGYSPVIIKYRKFLNCLESK